MAIRTQRSYDIHFYEVDSRRKAMPECLLNFFDDLAVYQSEMTVLNIDELTRRGIGWMLLQWHVRFYSYPRLGDTVIGWTEAQGFKGFYASRKYGLNGEKGKIAEAESVWLLLDFAKKRPLKITPEIPKAYQADGTEEVPEIKKLEAVGQADWEKDFHVRHADIDTNLHVNNVTYLEWALETIPPEVLENSALSELRVQYKKDIAYGQKILSRTRDAGGGRFLHEIRANGEILAMLETVWG